MPERPSPPDVAHARTCPSHDSDAARWQRLRGFVNARVFGDALPSVGRYRLIESIGSGGMGVVFSALDTELQREVAIKLLTTGTDRTHHHRLQREARAMARVAHPNVVGVYDVGEHEGELFVAMELVRGQTLRAWLTDEPRSWRAIAATFASAACGLAAAHAAGLVHRDFKPENVLIADSGRVCVVDFGLVTRGAIAEGVAADIRDGEVHDIAMSVPMLGTPAYMAPEQVLGKPVDARADVWSFCVALFEALYGVRPFDREDAPRTFAAIVKGDIRGGTTRRFPRGLDRIVRAGLCADREQRTATMDGIARDLERVLAARRRRWTVVAATAGLAAFATVSVRALDETPSLCADPEGAIAAVWSDDARRAIADRFAAHGLPGDAVAARIDAYAARWTQEMEASCALDDGSLDILARRMCLEARRQDLAGATSILVEADEILARNSDPVLTGLAEPSTCVDAITRPRAATIIEPADERTLSWRLDLARARAWWNAGDDPRAAELARATFDAATAAEAWVLAADAGVLVGAIADVADEDLVPVVPVLQQALAAADRSGHVAAGARATALLLKNPDYDELELQRRYARAYALAEANDDVEAFAILAIATRRGGGAVFGVRDRSDADARFESARALAVERLGPGHRLTRALETERFRRRPDHREVDEVRAELVAAQARWGAASGQAGRGHADLAGALARNGRLAEAVAEQTRAIEILHGIEGELGQAHIAALVRLFELHRDRGDIDTALAVADRAIAALDRVPARPTFMSGPSPVRTAVARMLLEAGKLDDAIPYAKRAVQDSTPYLGLPAALILAELHVRGGRPHEAEILTQELWSLMLAPEPGIAPVSTQQSLIKLVRGEARLALGRFDEAYDDLATCRTDLLSNMHREALRARVGLARIALHRGELAETRSALEAAAPLRDAVATHDPVRVDLAAIERELTERSAKTP